MILEAIKYIRLEGKSKEWSIEGVDQQPVKFGNINLLVGKNAAGKSRTLAAIREVSGFLCGAITVGDAAYESARYDLYFMDASSAYKYTVVYEGRKVITETLTVNDQLILDRENKKIYSQKTKDFTSFPNIKDNKLVPSVKYDLDEYPFFEKLYRWGDELKNAAFTNQIEKNFLLKDLSQLEDSSAVTAKNPIALLRAFWMGKRLFGNDFVSIVKSEMNELGYPIKTIDILEGRSGYGIYVEEDEFDDLTSQLEMSQGMYRAMAFIIQLNLAVMSKMSVCILIDDLGEGLDFDRSKLLIDMLTKSINDSNIQIFITTNDRYIMNKLPLKYWSVIERYPHKSVFYNYFNSKETFEDFKYTGLSNFDFLATDFYIKGFDEVED